MDPLKDMLYSSDGGHLVQVIDFMNREAERDGSQSHFKDTARTKVPLPKVPPSPNRAIPI